MSEGFKREYFADMGREILGRARSDVNNRFDVARAEGFEAAADICLNVLSRSIDGLLSRIKSGTYLTDQEQFLLSTLNDLKSETENELRIHWDRPNTP